MKKIILLLFVLFISCNTEKPKQFSEPANLEMLIGLDGTKITFREVINKYKGQKIVIDFWASWCKDCFIGFPKIEKLQKDFPDVVFLFLSTDFSKPSWKRAVKKYNIKGEHYNLPKGMNEGDLVNFINLSWLPTYMIIDENGEISLFKATNLSDKNIRKALER